MYKGFKNPGGDQLLAIQASTSLTLNYDCFKAAYGKLNSFSIQSPRDTSTILYQELCMTPVC